MIEEADYVVIGAGTAGCVVASRLSEDPWTKVALLEAGGSDLSIWIQLPIGYGRTFFDKRINWMYETEAVPSLGGRSSYWPRGKVVGGSGSINAMVHVRGFPHDYDGWAAAGNPGWGWDDVLPFFTRSEDHDIRTDGFHGQGGPQHVTDISASVHPLCNWFLETGRTLGHRVTADFNGPDGEGFGIYQINTRGGWRASTANAYYHPVRHRSNLTLIRKARVLRVVFEGTRAVGVAYRQGGRERIIRARREVVLCAGSIGSPQLLQVSGVGDAALLQGLGIPVVAELPAVGLVEAGGASGDRPIELRRQHLEVSVGAPFRHGDVVLSVELQQLRLSLGIRQRLVPDVPRGIAIVDAGIEVEHVSPGVRVVHAVTGEEIRFAPCVLGQSGGAVRDPGVQVGYPDGLPHGFHAQRGQPTPGRLVGRLRDVEQLRRVVRGVAVHVLRHRLHGAGPRGQDHVIILAIICF